jgi:DnaJ-class molecular chaperone
MIFQSVCRKCQGQGTFIKDPCGTCHATGVTKIRAEENI